MKYLAILVSVLFLTNIYGQEEAKTSLLWEISGKKVKSPSYIFGTMHLIPKDDFYFPEDLKNKVTSTEMLVMEIGGIAEQTKAAQLLMLEDGSLFDFFTAEQLDSIFDYSEKSLGYNEAQMRMVFGRMKPFVLLQMFTKEQFGENPESYELQLELLAKSNKMKVAGLETIEEQMGFIDNLSTAQQVTMVMEAIKGANEEMDESTRGLIDAYLSQDLDKIQEYMKSSESSSPEIEEKLLVNRNRNWIKPIKKIVKKNSAFIAVGAAHLAGEEGIIHLLEKEGYTLKPIKF